MAYLKQLQSILIEFDPVVVPTESIMIRYFEEGLKLFIKVKMDQDATHLDIYKELVAKAVKTKTKVGMQPSLYIQETNLNCPWENQSAYATAHKVQTKGFSKDSHKDNQTGEPKGFNSQHSNNAEESKKEKDKKKRWQQKKDSNTSAIGVNAEPTRNGGTLMKQKQGFGFKKDLSEIICYNYDKKTIIWLCVRSHQR